MAAAFLWSILGLLFALPVFSSANWRQPLLGSLTQWWAWGLVTPLIFWTDARLPFKEKQLGMRILAHFLASLVLTILYVYVFAPMRASVGLSPWSAIEGCPGGECARSVNIDSSLNFSPFLTASSSSS
jgi:two-component system, LytTR family, sensor kinase